ncbi:predicted protein [Haematococcus lacustris]|uniref:BACK domain-containing protein n=1 Tax=Haematococcus lacustris TaxID=44745 RepID=A0A699YJ18_HAELA|nr:predicted protein [Haematococcus lacustris]
MDFAQNSLETGNAIQYLNQAVQFNCDSFRDSCVTLVAEGFPASFSRSTDGLPTEVMLEVLQHPRLLVQTEEQVLVFVLNYVARHELSADTRHQLFSLVRLPFLSNDRLAQLTLHAVFVQGMGWVSRNLLPRRTYTSILHYGLPGGSEFACVPLHEVWEELVPQLHVRVSGDVVEGDAESILRVHDQDSAWFVVSGDSGQQPVWIEVELPPNMRVVELQRYTFSHGMNFANHMLPYGISDSAWFQMKGLVTQVSAGEGEPFHTLRTSESSTMQFEYAVDL